MEQAKWYYIRWNTGIGSEDFRPPGCKKRFRRRVFHKKVFIHLLKEAGLKRIYYHYHSPWISFFCGEKKLKKLIEEAHLLGLEDELLIFKKGETND